MFPDKLVRIINLDLFAIDTQLEAVIDICTIDPYSRTLQRYRLAKQVILSVNDHVLRFHLTQQTGARRIIVPKH